MHKGRKNAKIRKETIISFWEVIMNSNGLDKARNVFLVLQILASLLTAVSVVISIAISKDINSYEEIQKIFGAVMTARVGAIVCFSASLFSTIITYFGNIALGKYIVELACSIGMFVINFIIAPFSSAENLARSLTSSLLNSLNNYGNQSSSISSSPSIAAPLIILIILAIIVFFISSVSINDQSKKNRSVLVKRAPEKTKFCGFCGAEIPSGNKFCGVCGKPASIDKICPNCGAKIPLGNSFCGKCGTKINPD